MIRTSLRPTEYKGETVTAYFDNLLPDSRRIRDRIQRYFGASSSSALDLLTEIGRDCVGAIQLLPESAPTPNFRTIEGRPLTRKGQAAPTAGSLSIPAEVDQGQRRQLRLQCRGGSCQELLYG